MIKTRTALRALILIFTTLLMGCGQYTSHQKTETPASSLEESPPPLPQPVPEIPQDPTPTPPVKPGINICSDLSLDDIVWPESLTDHEIEAFALALNISGSFEGSSGWSNLTNNFDGQGMSFGLLNQTLGTNSLQPLLVQYSQSHWQQGQSIFGSSHWQSLVGMVEDWLENIITPTQVMNVLYLGGAPQPSEGEFVGGSPDQDKFYLSLDGLFHLQDAKSQRSIQWAINNLYQDSQGKVFKSSWKSELKTLGDIPTYVSLQVLAAERLHQKTIGYLRTLNFNTYRAYLFLFDIVVQNGGLKSSHISQFNSYKNSHPSASEQELLLQLLEIRVMSSLPQWRDDVRRRKKAIILGEGTVHGSRRDLPKEYCYDPLTQGL
ncbi:MAG: hypothetical protein KDD34_01390 [Bdellovibrionales bacterium]|nr:hypothetical protein [Bdellovibrionales bacterium]